MKDIELSSWIKQYELPMPDNFLSQMASLKTLLYSWNAKHNLTRIPASQFERLHVLDSLVCAALDFEIRNANCIIDIGTGPGFPGLPLAALFPDKKFTLVDKSRKKITFIDQAVSTLGLTNVVAVHDRLESLAANSNFAASYEVVVSRALAPLGTLLQLAEPFLGIGGRFIFPKSVSVFSELEEIDLKTRDSLGIMSMKFIPYSLAELGDSRYLAIFEKHK